MEQSGLILIDTSVWINYIRKNKPVLEDLLQEETVLTHPFVLGELLLGHLKPESETYQMLRELPTITQASDEEVLCFIEERKLSSTGIGLVDTHLLASCLVHGARFWTDDKALDKVAQRLHIAIKVYRWTKDGDGYRFD